MRGPQVMKGYWNKPEESAKVMTPDGFLRTGDIATIDENGFVRIVDRKKDMINLKTAVGVGWSADCLARPAVVGQLGARRGGERN